MAARRPRSTAAKDALSYAALRAPFAGRVAARPVNVGDVVNPGMTLVEIEGEGGLEIRATVEQGSPRACGPGAKVRARGGRPAGPARGDGDAVVARGRRDHATASR